MPKVYMRKEEKQVPKQGQKKAKIAAFKPKAEPKPMTETKKTKSQKKDDSVGGTPMAPASSNTTDLKLTIASLKGEVNEYKQQVETARSKLESIAGAMKPVNKGICCHPAKGLHCSYGDKCGYIHCNPKDPDKKPLPNHPKEGAGPNWPPPVKPRGRRRGRLRQVLRRRAPRQRLKLRLWRSPRPLARLMPQLRAKRGFKAAAHVPVEVDEEGEDDEQD